MKGRESLREEEDNSHGEAGGYREILGVGTGRTGPGPQKLTREMESMYP